MWYQQTLTLSAKPRGFHLVTGEIVGQIRPLAEVHTGLLHLLLQHTSASLTLNENCDPTVRIDMEHHFMRHVPESASYQHDYEGADDMPAHIKSSLLGVSLLLPVSRGARCWGPGRASGSANTATMAVHDILSLRYKENNNEHFGSTALLYE